MYADLDELTLRQLLINAMNALSSLTGNEKTSKEEEIEKIKICLNDACGERMRREHGLHETTGGNNFGGNNSERNQRMRDLKIAVDSIPRFSPGMCVQVFINQLTNKHKLYVECDDKSDQAVSSEIFRFYFASSHR